MNSVYPIPRDVLLTGVFSELRFSVVLVQRCKNESRRMGRTGKSILLVEPEGVLAEVMAFRLELLGYEVRIVTTAEEVLKCVSTAPFDLVITDLVLGETTATALIEALASREDTNEIPIMVLSIDADLDRVTTVHQAGAADFLVVPFQPEVLETKVAKLLERPRTQPTEKNKLPAE